MYRLLVQLLDANQTVLDKFSAMPVPIQQWNNDVCFQVSLWQGHGERVVGLGRLSVPSCGFYKEGCAGDASGSRLLGSCFQTMAGAEGPGGVCVCVYSSWWLHLVPELQCGLSLRGLVWISSQHGRLGAASLDLLVPQDSTRKVLEKPTEAALPFLT